MSHKLLQGCTAVKVVANFADLGFSGTHQVRDLWQQKNLGTATGMFQTTVPRHGAALVKIARSQ